MEIPKKLYKYESFNELSLKNLKRQCIYFANPSGFNDPYDCAISAELRDLTPQQIEDFKNSHLNNEAAPDNIKQYLKENSHQFISEQLMSIVSVEVNKLRKQTISTIGITCLSESNSDLLMWSHYGGRYKGFCLEFDSRHPPFTKARKVIYSDEMPKFDPFSFMKYGPESQFMDLFCIKSKSWSYEKEWRVFHLQAGTKFIYEEKALTGIYFGPDMDPECLEIIALIIGGQNEHVKLYKGRRSSTYFKVEFEEIQYTPHIIAKKSGLL